MCLLVSFLSFLSSTQFTSFSLHTVLLLHHHVYHHLFLLSFYETKKKRKVPSCLLYVSQEWWWTAGKKKTRLHSILCPQRLFPCLNTWRRGYNEADVVWKRRRNTFSATPLFFPSVFLSDSRHRGTRNTQLKDKRRRWKSERTTKRKSKEILSQKRKETQKTRHPSLNDKHHVQSKGKECDVLTENQERHGLKNNTPSLLWRKKH